MKEPLGQAARGANKIKLRRAAFAFPFHIVDRWVAYASKVAAFSIETPSAIVELSLFNPECREPFVRARRVGLLESKRKNSERLAVTAEASAVLTSSEDRFDVALDQDDVL